MPLPTCVYRTSIETMSRRSASSTARRRYAFPTESLFQLPNNRVPSVASPSPHPSQNAAPVMAIVGVKVASGICGFGPSTFVSGQFCDGPHP